jgi:hypothetical protein
MEMVVLAAVCSVIALLTGIFAIGSGRHWQFDNIDIVRGKRNAILYIWVTASSLFSLAHTTANVGYVIDPIWGVGPDIQFWFALHAVVGVLLSVAHLYVYLSLERHPGRGDEFLWGKRRVRDD